MLREIFSYFSSTLLIKWGWMKVDQEKERERVIWGAGGCGARERGIDREGRRGRERASRGGREGRRPSYDGREWPEIIMANLLNNWILLRSTTILQHMWIQI